MICEMRVKPINVLFINGIANMTSVDCATQLVDDCQVKRREGDPKLTKAQSPERR